MGEKYVFSDPDAARDAIASSGFRMDRVDTGFVYPHPLPEGFPLSRGGWRFSPAYFQGDGEMELLWLDDEILTPYHKTLREIAIRHSAVRMGDQHATA